VKVMLKYFSGTGNSYRVLDECKNVFIQNNYEVELSSITDKPEPNEEADLIGFCFPVYGFGIPRICRNYLLNQSKFLKPVKAFVLISAGDPNESGFSIQQCEELINRKNLSVIYSDVIHMPPNWTVAINPPAKEEAQVIIDAGIKKAKNSARNILNNEVYLHTFNYPPEYSKFRFYRDYYLFKYIGLSSFWKSFKTDTTCNSCGLCEKYCPTNSIKMINDKPQWAKTCEQCMRCVNYCPKKSIFQSFYGKGIKDKNTYHEPGFGPKIWNQIYAKNS
jgi:formate hydrogenlyase subunit 6/NADH:ubiquinone oxidoreductase subunit I